MPDQPANAAQTAPAPTSGTAIQFESWTWLLGAYSLIVLVVVFYAAHVALSGRDKQHRADAYKVLKLTWGAATSVTGLIAITLRLVQTGLL
jgi:hypothetical protein